jgi:uncharacterized membrane protein (UPF0136 family)
MTFKKPTSFSVLIYGLLLIALGWLGYTQGHSKMSLYAGGSMGAFIALSGLLMLKNVRAGGYAAIGLTLLMTGLFAFRYSVTGKTMPAILSVISGGMLLYLLASSVKWHRE